MRLTPEEIKELQALPIPRCESITVTVKPKEYGGEPVTVELKGFESFLPITGRCINCESELGGIFGHFSWGLCWGEGQCSCGWPGRAYHKVKLPDDTEEILQAVMQYHPDELELKEEAVNE